MKNANIKITAKLHIVCQAAEISLKVLHDAKTIKPCA